MMGAMPGWRARAGAPAPGQLGLFGGGGEPAGPKLEPSQQKVLEALRAVMLEETTPLEALNLLARLQRELK
jgi:DNA mismatch repair protein MutS